MKMDISVILMKGFKFVYPQKGNKTYLKVALIKKEIADNFDASAGGTVSIEGASLNFKANSIVNDITKETYNGSVDVYFHQYDIDDNLAGLSMPGDLRGVDAENNIRALTSFGMAAVELIGSNGEKLNLKENTTATLSIEAPNVAVLPETMPMWYFNEVTGFWVEDGSCALQDGNYVSEVSHFSFWNCDAPFDLITVSGSIVNSAGLPIANAFVIIKVEGSGLSGTGYTNQFGEFTGKVPKDENLILSIVADCGLLVTEIPIGSFNTDTTLPPFEVSDNGFEITVIGEVMCNGNPLSEGYVHISYGDSNYFIVELDDNGAFEEVRFLCDANLGDFTATAYSTAENFKSDEINFTVEEEGIFDLGMIDACALNVDEYIRIYIDGEDQGYSYNVEAEYGVTGLHLSGGDSITSRLLFSLRDPIIGDQHPYTMQLRTENGDYSDCLLINATSTCETMTVNLEEITRTEGEYLRGVFEGTLYNINQPNSPIISGEFEIKLDSYTPNAVVKGRVWEDTNENGIQDPDEPGINDNLLRFSQATGIPIVTYGDGNFVTHVAANLPFNIFLSNTNWIPTLQDAGSEDVDSDLNADGMTEEFNLSDGDYLLDIGVGLKTPLPIECEILTDGNIDCPGDEVLITAIADVIGNTCTSEVTILNDIIETFEPVIEAPCDMEGGSITFPNATDDMSIIWEGINSTEFTLSDLAPGIYVYEITSANGCVTPPTTVVVPASTGTIGNQIWVDTPGGSPNVFDTGDIGLAGVLVKLYDVEASDFIAELTTDVTGKYIFTAPTGEYMVEFILPAGYEFVPMTSDVDDNIGSKVDPVTGMTHQFTIECGQVKLNVDAGVQGCAAG